MNFETKMQLILFICMGIAIIIAFILAYFDNKKIKKEQEEFEKLLKIEEMKRLERKKTDMIKNKSETKSEFKIKNNNYDLMELEILDDLDF